MKAFDIALKDLTRSLRSAIGLVFMFGIPLGMTGLFYLMFGMGSRGSDFALARIRVATANLDRDAPRLHIDRGSLPADINPHTMSELVVEILASQELADLLEVSQFPSAEAARQAVDSQQAQVAIIIPAGFARQFYEPYGQSEIELYQDPTLTIGPAVVKALLSQFMDSLSGLKISTDLVVDELSGSQAGPEQMKKIGAAIEELVHASQDRSGDPAAAYLESRTPGAAQPEAGSLKTILGPILVAMMVFYAYYTGVASAESLLREEAEGTLPRLFTTPTPQATILTGKFLSVLLTVGLQIGVTLVAGRLLFNIQWGPSISVAWAALGTVLSGASFGIFVNSWLKDDKQGAVVFGGVLTFTGMLGMVRVFGMSNPSNSTLTEAISQIVPQGWAIRGMLQAMGSDPVRDVMLNTAVLLGWTAVFFVIGVWRFNRRYA